MRAANSATSVAQVPLGRSMTAYGDYLGDPTDEAREVLKRHAENMGIGGVAVRFIKKPEIAARRLKTYEAAVSEGIPNIACLGGLAIQGEGEVVPIEVGDSSTLVVITGFGDVTGLQQDITHENDHSS